MTITATSDETSTDVARAEAAPAIDELHAGDVDTAETGAVPGSADADAASGIDDEVVGPRRSLAVPADDRVGCVVGSGVTGGPLTATALLHWSAAV